MLLKDPVCGKRINRGKAHIAIEYESVNYLFSVSSCNRQNRPCPFQGFLFLSCLHSNNRRFLH